MCKFKTIKFYAKCSDLFMGTLTHENGNEIEHDGYPFGFLGDGNGISMEIDLKTGQILNWVAPDEENIRELVDYDEEIYDEDWNKLNNSNGQDSIDWENDPEYADTPNEPFSMEDFD